MNPAPPKPSRPWQGRHAPLGPVRGIPSPRTEHTDMGGGLGRCRPPSLSGRKLREPAGKSRPGFGPYRQDSDVRLRIEHVPQPVAEHRAKDGGSGDQREPRRDLDVLKPHLHHVAPGWRGGLRPEADEAEAGLQDDRERGKVKQPTDLRCRRSIGMETNWSVTGPRADISRSSRSSLEPARVGPVQERWRGRYEPVGVRGEAQRCCCAPVGGVRK